MTWSQDSQQFAEDLFEKAQQLGFGQLHCKIDAKTGMQAVIAIHNEARGPALGGARFYAYPNSWAAILDAMRLARGMTYKAAMANLPHGGGKAVLIQPTHIADRAALFRSFGGFINDLNGRYITAVDSGTCVADMDVIAETTHYVTCSEKQGGDPSYFTALGVFEGIKAAIEFVWGDRPLNDTHVLIQGVGNVGYHLATLLHQCEVKLTVSDVNHAAVSRCVEDFNAQSVDPALVYDIPCDVFAPCALGAILNDDTISRLKTPIVAGSANNQLASPRHAAQLQQQQILYATDYVINAGGLIYAAAQYDNVPKQEVINKVNVIKETLLDLFQRSEKDNRTPTEMADQIAQERIHS